MADRSRKTEEPTQKRLEKARKEGQYASAKEIIGALQFMVFVVLLGKGAAIWFERFRQTTRSLFSLAYSPELRSDAVIAEAWRISINHLLPLAAGGLVIVMVTVGLRLITTRFGFSSKKLLPDVGRLNPMSRLRQLPAQNLTSLVQVAMLIPICLWAVYAIARERLNSFLTLPLQSVESGFSFIGASVMDLFWKASWIFLVFGGVSFYRELRRHKRDLRMDKQEIKEEAKEMQGNPHVKAKIRRIQRDHARRQMMKEISTATAVVVNPTHFAVAIRYRIDRMAAPLVVAKGKNYLALRIRQRAIEHQVPIIENPPLAQALYKSVDVGQEIPPHLYRAVAEILAYIFKLMNGRLPG